MARTDDSKRVFQLRGGDFSDAYEFAENLLARKDVGKEAAQEALLVFEALMHKLVDWGLGEDTELEIAATDKLGDFRVVVGFEGKVFSVDGGSDSIEDRILDAHKDKLNCNYYAGYNEIGISVSRNNHTAMFACIIASLFAIVVYLPLSVLVDASAQASLLDDYVFPLEKLYANAMLMVGAPMTFFSLLKNMTDTYVVSRRNSGMRQLQARTLATSVIAMLVAFVAFPS